MFLRGWMELKTRTGTQPLETLYSSLEEQPGALFAGERDFSANAAKWQPCLTMRCQT
jgi:hypothetical protein